ncbi:hypothetical protein OH76DRAFT_1347352, partial [Lentinus brumalis]
RKVINAILYPVATSGPRSIPLPVLFNPDDDIGASGLVEDVRVQHWFPHGTVYTRIHVVPGTTLTLTNDYTIVTSRHPERAPHNQSIDSRLSAVTRGNVLVLRHARQYSSLVTNIHSSERNLVEFVVRQ